MRLAFISDIHANLPALESTLIGLDTQQPDAIYCLGDLVNQNVWNNEVVDLIRERAIACVQGNHDQGIGLGKTKFRFSYTHPDHKVCGLEAIAYTLKTIRPDNQAFLAALPLTRRLEIPHRGSEPFTILLAHGSPVSIDDTLFRHMPKNRYRHFLDIAGTDALICGQANTPYHYRFEPTAPEKSQTQRHVICPGSVGRPQDGDWRASYMFIDLDTTRDLHHDPKAVQIHFYRITYDIDKAVKAIRHSELSVYYGGCLITGQ